MSVLMPEPKNTLLGKDTVYSDRYNPDLLQPIPRTGQHAFHCGVEVFEALRGLLCHDQDERQR